MSDIKWIKITTDIFDDEKLKVIDRYPARDEIIVIWFKLLTLAGKVNQSGLLFMNSRIPYTSEMLSAVFNREESTVKMALSVFEKYGMIHIEENNVIAVSNWEKHQNIDGMEKIKEQTKARVSRHREKQKQLMCNVTCNATVTQGNAIELDIELDKDKKNIKTFLSDSIEYRLADYLFKFILKNNPNAKQPNLQSWSKDIDLMIRLDNRDPDEIKKVIEFCQKDSFWKANILSTSALRKQYEKLYLKTDIKKQPLKPKRGSIEII